MNAVLLVAGWCVMVASGTPAQTARQQLRAQQPVDALMTLRQAGLGTPAYRADGSTGMLAVAAQQAGESALALQALHALKKGASLKPDALLAVEARVAASCVAPCVVPVRSHGDVMAHPLEIQARYLEGLHHAAPARAVPLARAMAKAAAWNNTAHEREARTRLLAAVHGVLEGANDDGAAVLQQLIWEQFPADGAVAYAARNVTLQDAQQRYGVAAVVNHLEALSAAQQNFDVVQQGELLCQGQLMTQDGPCPALPRALGCRVAFVVGKSVRQARKPEDAERILQGVAGACPELGDRARYLQARATMAIKGAGPRAVETLTRLALEHPQSTLADDGLLLAGELLMRLDDAEGARRLWERQLTTFPKGDMAPQAAWWLAWHDAQGGRLAEARARTSTLLAAPELQWKRKAAYWLARWEADAKVREAALMTLVGQYPLSVEAALARGVLAEGGAMAPPLAAVSALKLEQPKLPARWFSAGVALLDAGLEEDAVPYLAAALLEPGMDVAACGHLLRTGQAPLASRHLRKAHAAELAAPPDTRSAAVWRMAYPAAFEDVVGDVVKESGVSPVLLWALAREESAFDPRARSTSGAVGLFQLLPATAVTEAMTMKVAIESENALLDPQLNARVAGSYLARLLRQSNGNAAVALAGYNAGPGNARAWLKTQPEQGLDVYLERIPITETRDYVQRVLQSVVVYSALHRSTALVFPVRADVATPLP